MAGGRLGKTGIEVLEARKGRTFRDFLSLPAKLYREDPYWVPPIPFERRIYFSDKNPIFHEKEIQLWTAYKNNKPVGRISAQISARDSSIGNFGCVESEDDPEVFQALFHNAECWLKERGAKIIIGPFNLSINDECGLPVEGLDSHPMVMMPYGRVYYEANFCLQGYEKSTDLLAYEFEIANAFSSIADRIIARASKNPRLRLRSIRPGDLPQNIQTIMEIYNDGWGRNWGFEPMTIQSAEYLAGQMKHVLIDGMIWIADVDGKPAAIALSIPNLNEALVPLKKGFSISSMAKMAGILLKKKYKSARTPLMGIRQEFHNTTIGAELALSVINATRSSLRELAIDTLEISWILEGNAPTRHIVESLIGARLYKRYRIFSKSLTSCLTSG